MAGEGEGGRVWITSGVLLHAYQVGNVDDLGDFAAGRGGLLGQADGVVDGDGHAGLLLADGAAHQGVAGGD